MVDLKDLQKQIFANKKAKGFNMTDPREEFLYFNAEVGEMMNAFLKKEPSFPEEMADVAIYLLNIAKMTGVDLEKEILKKIEKNKKRKYEKKDGVLVRIEGK